MRPQLLRTAVLSSLAILLASCSDDATTPTAHQTPDVVERPTTVATARATTAASVWATNDLAALAAHWADGDLRSAPRRFDEAPFDDAARFDDTTKRWTVPLTSDFHVGPERYEVVGRALVTYLADGIAVADVAHATALRAEVTLDVLPRLQKGLERDLELTTTVTLTVDDLGTRPLALSGDGHTAGRYSLVDDTTDQRASVDLTWGFALSTVYRDCCPSGVVGLALDAWQTQVTLDGSPTVATQMVVDREWVEDVNVDLPCVLVQEARGTSLRSGEPLLRRAHGGDRVLSLVSGEEAFSPALGPRAAGTLSLHGFLGGESLIPATVRIAEDTRLDEALLQISSQLEDRNRWITDFAVDETGRMVLDNSSQTSLPASTTLVAVYGNLDSESAAKGSHLLQTGPLLAAAEGNDDLRYVHTSADGNDMQLSNGLQIALTGRIAGVEIPDTQFEIGEVAHGDDGTTLEELRAWFETNLRANGAPHATVVLNATGRFEVTNAASDPLMEDIGLAAGGPVSFDQAITFGNQINAGTTKESTAGFLSPATEDDVLDELYNDEGESLNFDFEDHGAGNMITSIRVGGTLGGTAITPAMLTVTEGVTRLSDLTGRLTTAFRISNADGITVDQNGRLEVEGDAGLDSEIGNIAVNEEGNLFSNLSTSIDFSTVDVARDATTFFATATVFDALGSTHDLTLSFTKRTGVHVWDWRASTDGDGTIVAGARGTVSFHSNGLLAGFEYADGATALVFVPSDDGADPVEIELWMGMPGRPEHGLTQFAYADALQTHADGQPYVRGADATQVELRLVATDGLRSEEIVLARFDVIPGGSTATAAPLARAAHAGATLADLVTARGVPIFRGATNTPRDLRVTLTADGRPTTIVRPVTPDVSTLADVRDAIVLALGTDGADVRVGPSGHVLVDAPLEIGAVTALQVEETAAENLRLESSLDFEVTAQAAAGCR